MSLLQHPGCPVPLGNCGRSVLGFQECTGRDLKKTLIHMVVCPKTAPQEDSEYEKGNNHMPDSRDSKEENRQVWERLCGKICGAKEGKELM